MSLRAAAERPMTLDSLAFAFYLHMYLISVFVDVVNTNVKTSTIGIWLLRDNL